MIILFTYFSENMKIIQEWKHVQNGQQKLKIPETQKENSKKLNNIALVQAIYSKYSLVFYIKIKVGLSSMFRHKEHLQF